MLVRAAVRCGGASARFGAAAAISRPGARAPVTRAASTSTGTAPGAALPNPLANVPGLMLLKPDGRRVFVADVLAQREGKVVLGLLRHAGWPLCWEQAKNLLQLKPQLESCGFALALVTIGDAAAGKTLCERLSLPESILFLEADADRRPLYKALALRGGMFAFFSNYPQLLQGWKTKDMTRFQEVLKAYKWVEPKNVESTSQMGGLFVFDKDTVFYAYQVF